MPNKPLIILGSSRKKSDTKKFLDVVIADIDHTLIDLLDYPVSGYDYSHNYPANDSYPKIITEVLNHNTIVFATPVYWYSMSALMKTFFDRFSDLVTYKKEIGRLLKGKSTLLLAVGADLELPHGFESPFKLTSAYLDMQFLGSIYYSTRNSGINESIAKLMEAFRKKLIDIP